MRFFANRPPASAIVLAVVSLLLLPSFFVFGQGNAAATPSPAAPASPRIPSASRPNSLSNYKVVGTADPNLPVLVSVVIPLRNLPMLSSLVKQFSDPSSPNFRQFLSYSEATRLFLPEQGQYQSVLDYLASSGFTVELSALNSMIVVRGTASQVSQYLGQSVEMLTNGTYSYYETTGASTLTGAYSFASNSSGLLMRPNLMRSASVASGATPTGNVTFAEGGQSTKLLQTVYNSTGLLSHGIDGRGYTVACWTSTATRRSLRTWRPTTRRTASPRLRTSP